MSSSAPQRLLDTPQTGKVCNSLCDFLVSSNLLAHADFAASEASVILQEENDKLRSELSARLFIIESLFSAS